MYTKNLLTFLKEHSQVHTDIMLLSCARKRSQINKAKIKVCVFLENLKVLWFKISDYFSNVLGHVDKRRTSMISMR